MDIFKGSYIRLANANDGCIYSAASDSVFDSVAGLSIFAVLDLATAFAAVSTPAAGRI